MKCPNCGFESDRKFCPECGTPLPEEPSEKKCPNCGEITDAKFCPNCGHNMGIDHVENRGYSKKIIATIACVVVVIIVVIVGFSMTNTRNKNTTKPDGQKSIVFEESDEKSNETNDSNVDEDDASNETSEEIEEVENKGRDLPGGKYTVGDDIAAGKYHFVYKTEMSEDDYWQNDYCWITRANSKGEQETLDGTKFDERVGSVDYNDAKKGKAFFLNLKKGDVIVLDSEFGNWTY